MKSEQWFKDQELSTVSCTLPNGDIKELTIVKTPEHYHKMQERGYAFEKKVKVHTPIDQSKICTDACEG